jgi:hypothetical protein
MVDLNFFVSYNSLYKSYYKLSNVKNENNKFKKKSFNWSIMCKTFKIYSLLWKKIINYF